METGEQALVLFESAKIQQFIKKLYRKVSRFSSCVDLDDCQNAAFEGIMVALGKYNQYRKKQTLEYDEISQLNISPMSLDNFVYWFLQKEIYKLAEGGEIEYCVWDVDGDHVTTLTSDEFRKQKKALEGRGCTFTSINLNVNIALKSDDGDDLVYEPVDTIMRGFEDFDFSSEHLKKIRR